jgi:hypothetical protein
MAHIEHIIGDDLITWDHGDGVCKLIRVPRAEIDEGSDEPDAWDLLWIEASTGIRYFEVRLDRAYCRSLDRINREHVLSYLATAPEGAAEILRPWMD